MVYVIKAIPQDIENAKSKLVMFNIMVIPLPKN